MNDSLNTINTIFPIASVMIGFILSVATYITATGIPKIDHNSLRGKIVHDDICTDVADILKRKKYLLERLKSIYLSILIILSLFAVFIITGLNQNLKTTLLILLVYFSIIFGYLALEIIKIIKINICIDNQILEEEK